MVFSSWQFIVLFLPTVLAIYFLLNWLGWRTAAKAWLVAASLFFYGYWDVRYLPLIIGSICINYAIGTGLSQSSAVPPQHPTGDGLASRRQWVLVIGICANLALLGYFKYSDFFISNTNALFQTNFSLQNIVLPLAISFFTFTQIGYLVDSHKGTTQGYDLLNYALFVTYFPHLIAGPIVQHGQVMPQFNDRTTWSPKAHNILVGLTVFGFGLFKKAGIADTLAIWSNRGFDASHTLNFYEAWVTSLSFTLQLYFDFSGYCDMAVGASLMFNIRLPDNFYSPYRATNIQEFWRRWHITLSSFLRDYVYIPLGGSRGSSVRTFLNLFATFVLGGFWHGATWMFVIWGALHGAATVAHRLWRTLGVPMPKAVAWLTTFMFVNVAWVFFRANSWDSAMRVLKGMTDLQTALPTVAGTDHIPDLAWAGYLADDLLQFLPVQLVGQLPALAAVALGLVLVLVPRKNTVDILEGRVSPSVYYVGAILGVIGLHFTLVQTSSVFLYFNF